MGLNLPLGYNCSLSLDKLFLSSAIGFLLSALFVVNFLLSPFCVGSVLGIKLAPSAVIFSGDFVMHKTRISISFVGREVEEHNAFLLQLKENRLC